MDIKTISLQASEKINNFTVCVQEELFGTVRNIKFRSDINSCKLVYVCNDMPKYCADVEILEGTQCRCIPIEVRPKTII